MNNLGTLYFFTGKMGAGKTTMSKQLTNEKNAVLLSEDEWLESLYPNKIKTIEDYQNLSKQIKPLIKKTCTEYIVCWDRCSYGLSRKHQKSKKMVIKYS